MSAIFRALLAVFGGPALAVLAVSFIRWNINVGSWPDEARGAVIIVGIMTTFVAIPLLFQKEIGL